MSPPQLGVGEEGRSNVSLVDTAPSIDHISSNGLGLKERNYLGLSDCSSVDGPALLNSSEDCKINLNLKATELRLGIPGSQSPERETDLCFTIPGKFDEKPLFPFVPSKDGTCFSTQNSGNKRGFSDTMDGFSGMKSSIFSEKWMFNVSASDCKSQQSVAPVKLSCHSGLNAMLSSGSQNETPPKVTRERPCTTNGKGPNETGASNHSNSGPAAKAQVVGWPPIRSFRKNTLSTNSKNNDEVDGKPGPGALFVKVSMDGAPYLRKVDLRTYSTYQELSSALEKMFSCFIVGQCGSQGAPGREMLTESQSRDVLHGSEYVLTYEDKDEDWMLVGDVPWEMFIDSCKRLKIMKSSDAIGLAPRAMEKSKNQS